MLAIIFLILPQQPITVDACDTIEVNHYYSDKGELCFTQFIFWDFEPTLSRYVVIDWRMSDGHMPHYLRGRWVLVFMDSGQLRRVEAVSAFESWTQVDPEIKDREFLPMGFRRKLGR